jgi:hypothetical protein
MPGSGFTSSKPVWPESYDEDDWPIRLSLGSVVLSCPKRSSPVYLKSEHRAPIQQENKGKEKTTDRQGSVPIPKATSSDYTAQTIAKEENEEQRKKLERAKSYISIKDGEEIVIGKNNQLYVIGIRGGVYLPSLPPDRKYKRYLKPYEIESILTETIKNKLKSILTETKMQAIMEKKKKFS